MLQLAYISRARCMYPIIVSNFEFAGHCFLSVVLSHEIEDVWYLGLGFRKTSRMASMSLWTHRWEFAFAAKVAQFHSRIQATRLELSACCASLRPAAVHQLSQLSTRCQSLQKNQPTLTTWNHAESNSKVEESKVIPENDMSCWIALSSFAIRSGQQPVSPCITYALLHHRWPTLIPGDLQWGQ